MVDNFRSFSMKYLVLILLISSLRGVSQENYSESALTGRGALILIGENFKLQKEVFEAFKKMQKEALKHGISIKVASGYRSFDQQKKIWKRKYKYYISKGLTEQQSIEKIIEYSTLPGTSRHHWGTDIDIIDANVRTPKNLLIEENYKDKGVYSKLKKWMDSNSERFGFYLVYDNIPNRKGFKFEPWHYSYKNKSKPMLNQFLKINLAQFYSSINLKGNEFITIKFLQKYLAQNILAINPNLK